MKILHCVETYFPVKGGMQEVVRQLSERLVRKGHDVTVATRINSGRGGKQINGVNIAEFDLAGNSVNGISGNAGVYEEFLLTCEFDIVTFFAAQQWATDIALPLLEKIKGKKVFVPTGFPGLFWKEFQGYYSRMQERLHSFDQIIFLSNDYKDINFARKAGYNRFQVIANGADEDEFLHRDLPDVRKELGITRDQFLILHVGSFSGFKGQLEALELFLRARIPHSVLLMIGNGFEHFRIPRRRPLLHARYLWNKWFGKNKIIIRQFSREYTVAAYKAADIFLFPSNIECSPIVLFESTAAGLPFLATEVGNSREIALWTEGGEIMKTDIDDKGFSHVVMKEGVIKLKTFAKDQLKRNQLSEAGFKNWQNKFTWKQIAEEYERLYSKLLIGA